MPRAHYTVSPTQTTTYTLTAVSNGCTTVSSATVTVLPAVVSDAGPDQSKCDNGNFTLAGNTPSAGTGTWSVVSGTASITDPSSPTSGVTGVPIGTSATLRWRIIRPPCDPVDDYVLLTYGTPPSISGINFCQGMAAGQLTYTGCSFGPVNIGPNLPYTGSNVTGTGTVGWVNAVNILTNDNANSTVTLSSETSTYLQATNFNFAIPSSATINGIQVTIGRYESGQSSGNDVRDVDLRLVKAGTRVGTSQAATSTEWPTSEGAANYGSTSNLWGTTWTAAEINASNFGVSLSVNSTNSRTAYVDYFQIIVTYTITGTANWYTVATGGSSVQSGSPFNPINDPQVLASGAPYSSLTNTNTPGTYQFWLECSGLPDCRSAAINYVIDPTPTAFTVTGGGAYCSGGPGMAVGLSGSQTGVNYQLRLAGNPVGAVVPGTGSAIDFGSQTAAGNYTVTAASTLPSACPATMNGTVTITINPLPGAAGTITGPSPVCAGVINQQYTVPAIANATGYTWTVPSGVTIVTGGNTNTIFVNFATSAVSGNITVAGTNACGTGTSASLSVTVNPAPADAGTITGPATVCQSQGGYVFTVPAISNANNYAWTITATGATITAGNGTRSITVSFNASATSGIIRVRGFNTLCSSYGNYSPDFNLTVSPKPVAAGSITGPTTVCQNQAGVAYSVPSITNATGYVWTLPTGATIATGSNSNSITVDFSTTGGSISVYGTNTCGNGTASSITVTANPNVTPTFAAVGPYCSGATIPALPTTSTNGITGTWSPAINNTTTTLYTFTPTAGQCATTATLTITVNPNVTPTFAAVGPYCSGATIPALPTTSTNGITGTWSPAINNTTTTLYTFTPTAGLCATTATLTITVNPNVTPTFAAVGPYCSGATIPALPTTSTNGITGTWSPAINNTATTTYTFTPTAGLCATTATLTITVNPNVTPTFAAVGPYCSGATIPALPTTSTNGITGTWSPAINNTATTTYTFTPTAGLCASTATLTITITPNVTPTFAPVADICSGATLSALPTTSTNGITGTWAPALNNTATTTYTFTPTAGLCATTATLTITVNPNVTPTFAAVGPYCSGATIPALPTTSTNGITGTWSPAINNTTTTTYTFTPTAGLCATTTTLTITVNPNVTPTFAAVGPYCSGATIPALPTTSTNGITGTWSPAINNTATTTLYFYPNCRPLCYYNNTDYHRQPQCHTDIRCRRTILLRCNNSCSADNFNKRHNRYMEPCNK